MLEMLKLLHQGEESKKLWSDDERHVFNVSAGADGSWSQIELVQKNDPMEDTYDFVMVVRWKKTDDSEKRRITIDLHNPNGSGSVVIGEDGIVEMTGGFSTSTDAHKAFRQQEELMGLEDIRWQQGELVGGERVNVDATINAFIQQVRDRDYRKPQIIFAA